MNMRDRYLDNLSTESLKQVIKFLLNDTDNRTFVLTQITEFNRMYP